jgi:hypothetical protein
MSKIKFAPNGIGSGEFTIAAPGTSTNRTINLPDTDGTLVLSDASGNVGIGGTSGGSKLEITGSSLGTTAGSQSLIQKLRVNVGNEDLCEITNTRQIAGSSWNGAGTRIQERIDATYMAYMQFNGGQTTANDGGISFGTGLQSTPTAVVERMRIDSTGNILQLNSTSGQGAIVGEQTFRLPSNLTAIGPGIADFFGATSSISLEASSVYEIRAYCMFNKTTAGTATWNLTYSSAPTFIIASYVASPITGIGAGTPTSGFAANVGVTTTAFPATGSLSTGVAHAFQFTIQVITNAATNFRFQLTQSLGTAVPVSNSYYRVKKIAASTGTFVA